MGNWWSQSDQTPQPGDLIEVFRVGYLAPYQHWAVYVGDDYVVHVTSPPDVSGKVSRNISAPGAVSNSLMSVPTEKAMVRKQKLKDVVGNNKWRINNSLDKKYKPRPASIIVEEALRQVDNVMEYSVTRKNCEHFATELRYGKPESRQVRVVEEAMAAAGAFTTLAAIAMAAVAIVTGRNRN